MNSIPIFLSPNMSRHLISAALAFLLCMCSANSSMALPYCIPRERDALLKFKSTFHDPHNRLSSWKGDNCCQWEGIACDNVTSRVVKLDLSNPRWRFWRLREQVGEHTMDFDFDDFDAYPQQDIFQYRIEAPNVDESLLQLEYLSYLDLSGNHFNYSPIPTFIGSMHRLTYLSLSEAGFGRRIPSSLGNLTNLSHLDLSRNYGFNIGFNILSDINWISKLASLEHLNLSNVDLGSFHTLFQVLNTLPSLSSISLHQCELDNLTYPLVNNVTNNNNNNNNNALPHQLLQFLDLSFNFLTRPFLDAAFQNMTTSQLVHLDLSWNPNLDSVPSWLSACEKLKYLDLSHNGLHGPIPDAFRNMNTSIESLYLSYNYFTLIPSWFNNFEKLVHLDFSYNGLSGPIPDTFQNITSIESLSLSFNHLTSVPCWFGEYKKLVHLDLSSNDLAHMECSMLSILTNLCRLKILVFSHNKLRREHIGDFELSGCVTYDLQVLGLHQNELRGPLPTWLRQLENLRSLDLGLNCFNGPIPFFLGELVKLEELDLDGNMFEGNLPNNIRQLVNLTLLDVSSNKLSGFIPQSLGELVHLQKLDLSNNNLSGTIPQSLGHLINLVHLNFHGNKLHGNIPQWSSIMPHLQLLNISYNSINGSLPHNIGNIMPFLDSLFLANNLITGSIPKSLCKTWLSYLDLSKNKLSGEIPNCWGQQNPDWIEINLSSNKLTGVFPSSLMNLYSLSWLHLNNNNLQGQLPVSVNEDLIILDLGENQFSGSIPSWTANNFANLQILRLRQNKLSGSIPSQLCKLVSLQILDLSDNNLEGSIPSCIGNLDGMIQGVSDPLPWANAPVSWSKEDVKQVMKGREDDYIKILKLVVNMDLSKNKLVGCIPEGITWLTKLHGLNVSYNQLEGEIPKTIANMISLESFDISHNKLSGNIPNSITALTSLSHLNLSNNNFSGPIPIGKQFSTFDSSVYDNNPYLCGHELPNKCPGDNSGEVQQSKGYEDGKKDKVEKLLFYFFIAIGFASGFWGVIVVLMLNKGWRHACFRQVEDVADAIYVTVAIKVAKLKKWMVRNSVEA